MPKTSGSVHFAFQDQAVKDDAAFSVNTAQSFVDSSDLNDFNVCAKWATFENDFWVLDGSFYLMADPPEASRVGYISGVMSDEFSEFSINPELTIDFDTTYSVDGLKLFFSKLDWVTYMRVRFYNSSNTLIQDDYYSPNTYQFYTEQPVANFKKIIITFIETSQPYRFVKLENIDFGQSFIFSDTSLKKAVVYEEIDPSSIKLPYNTLDIEILRDEDLLGLIDTANDYPIDIYGIIDIDIHFMGRFYLSSWELVNNNLIKINAVDMLGKYANVETDGGVWGFTWNTSFWGADPYGSGKFVNNPTETADNVFDSIMSDSGLSGSVDPSLSSENVYGWLKINGARDALRNLAFGVGGYVTCARSLSVQMLPLLLANDIVTHNYEITRAMQARGTKKTIKEQIKDFVLTTAKYHLPDPNDDLTVLFYAYGNSYFAIGVENIKMLCSKPCIISTTYPRPFGFPSYSGTYTKAVNYIVLNSTATRSIIIDAPYCTFKNNEITTNVNANGTNLYIKDAQLVTNSNSSDVIDRVVDYISQRYVADIKTFGIPIAPGDSVLVDISDTEQISGIAEKVETDLMNGFVSKIKVVGIIA